MFNALPKLIVDRSESYAITLDQLVSKITTPNSSVFDARSFGRGTVEYDNIKRTRIESYFPNSFEGSPTGYLYADIDNFPTTEHAMQHKEFLKKLPYVALCWLSLSNRGLSILIKVDAMNADNYFDYWDSINERLDNRLDKQSRGFTKPNVISYDPLIYINPNPIPFDLLHQIRGSERGISSTLFQHKIISSSDTFLAECKPLIGLNYRTYLPDAEFENVNTPVVKPEGKPVLEINLIRYRDNKIQIGHRNSTIGAMSMQLIVMNPLAEKIQILNALLYINKHYCETSLQYQEVRDIFNANYDRFLKDGLDISKYLKLKYVFFHKLCNLPANEKKRIAQEALLNARGKGRAFSEGLINDAIECLQDGEKITQNRVAEFIGIPLVRIKRYWKPFKNVVKDYNENLK